MNQPEPHNVAEPLIVPNTARTLRMLLYLAACLFTAGVILPMFTLSKFVLMTSTFSVLSGVMELLRNGQVLLFLLLTGFSLVLPVLKMLVLYQLLSVSAAKGAKLNRYLHLMHDYGRWSMLDVLVVAILLVTVKLGAIVSIEIHLGLYLFGASVLLLMLITHRLVRLTTAKEVKKL